MGDENHSHIGGNNLGISIIGNNNTVNSSIPFDNEQLIHMIETLQIFTNKKEFLKEYFGKDWKQALLNSQTYHNLKIKLLEVNSDTQKLLNEKKDLLKRIDLQKLNGSIQKMIDRAFSELRYNDVRDLLDEFIERNQQIGNDIKKAHYQKALSYMEELKYHEAKQEFEDNIPIGIKDYSMLYDFAVVYSILSEYEKSSEMFEKSLKVCNDEMIVLSIYNSISKNFYALGKYDKALEYIDKVFLNFPNTEINIVIADSYDIKGIILSARKEYDEAIFFCIKALEIRGSIFGEESIEVAVSYGNIGLIYHYLCNYVDALKYHELDLSIKKRIYPLNHQLLGDTYLNIGFVYHDNNEYEESLIFFNKALSIYQETLGENSDATALAYNNIFSALNNLNNYKEAYRNLQKALKIWRKIFPNTHPYIINAEKDLNKLQEKLSLNKSKISRNAPCICGSGIKYKKCCGM